MRQLLTDLQVSATATTPLLDLSGFGRPWILMAWQFELVSGSGNNTLTIGAKIVANWEDDPTTETTFDLTHASHWRGPLIVDNSMISAAASSKLKSVADIRAMHDHVKLTFTYGGAGSRVFKVNLWAR